MNTRGTPKDAETTFRNEIEQAKAGTHHRQRNEEKRLNEAKLIRIKDAEREKQVMIDVVNAQYQASVNEAEEEYNREKAILQDQIANAVIERHKRMSSAQDQNSIRAMTRRYRQTRSEAAVAVKVTGKRDVKSSSHAQPLLQGEMEEDFEDMAKLAEAINPSLDVSFLDVEVRDKDRARQVEAVVNKGHKADTISNKRPRRGDFNFKGKARGEVSGSKITVWYEEEHGGHKIDVPYVGIVNSCDPREGHYVKFDDYPEEMLITNEDDWRWGSHSRKPTDKK